jgi:excinuclease UvrABC helicase subunit UvrB
MDYAATPSIEESTASRIAEKARNWDAMTLRGELAKLRDDMSVAANELRYEEAAMLRDQIRELEALELSR